VSEAALKSLTKCQDLVNIKTLICYDNFTEEQIKYFADKGNDEIIKVSN
jgi:apolipoprotein N-acyltransferase